MINEGWSRIKLMTEVYTIMAMPKKAFEGTNKPTRESLLVDTLIAKGFRFVEEKEEKPKVIPFYSLDYTQNSSLHMDGTAKYVIRNVNEPGIVAYLRLSKHDAISLNILFSAQQLGIKAVYDPIKWGIKP